MNRIILSAMLCLGGLSIVSGQDMPTSSSVMDFSGGLNSYSSPIYLQPNESPDLLNTVIDEPLGALTQRKGYLLCGHIPSGLTATNLFEFNKSDGSHSLIVTDNISIWSTPDCTQWTTIATGLSQLFIPRFATINDRLWIVNGSTWTSTWDGTTRSLLDGHNSSTPLAPKGRYILNWKNRVWIASPTTDPSAVMFNSLTDPLGTAIDPAISTNSWPSLNTIYFGKNDGSPIYGLYPYKDNLLVFKERSMWRLLWESEFNLNVVKSVSSIGSKFQDSIVEMDDGSLRYIGTDGIYGYTGGSPVRMSTKITPNFYAFKQPSRAEQSKIWDTDTDFIQGTLINIDTFTTSGFMQLNIDISSRIFETWDSTSAWALGAGTNRFQILDSQVLYNGGVTSSGEIYRATDTANWGNWEIGQLTSSQNSGSLSQSDYYFVSDSSTTSNMNGYGISAYSSGSSCVFSLYKVVSGLKTDLANKSVAGKVLKCGRVSILITPNGDITTTGQSSLCSVSATDTTFSKMKSKYQIIRSVITNSGSSAFFGDIYIPDGYTKIGTYTTQITTATGLSQWGTFDALSTNNGQTLTYDIRTASTVYNLGLKSYRSITPGAIVSTNTTEGFAQVRANFSTSDNSVTPLLDRLSLGWITGDTSVSTIKGLVYKSRYWLVGSTQIANQYNDTTIVESKPPLGTYTLYNLPLSAMTLWNGNLYAAISNTDKVVRLDYGTSDDGTAISSYWQSRDEVYQNPVKYKTINRGILDYIGLPSMVNVGLSPDSGGTWQDIPLSISVGPRKTSIFNFDANMSSSFRTRITHSVLDSTYLIYGLHTTGTTTNFIGN